MKILYVTTIGGTMTFFKSFIKELMEKGDCVDIASNTSTSPVPQCYDELGCKIYQIPCSRSPFNKGNISAYGKLKKIIENENYDIVHCHTPIAAFITRLAARSARKKGTRVLYTAHGFHFFKGAPLLNWLIYFPIEWISSFFTDILITINREDYKFAKRCFHAKNTYYVHGVGINAEKPYISQSIKNDKRKEINVPDDAVLLLSVGEINKNKNHEAVLRALAKLDSNIYYCVAGKGSNDKYLLGLADELGVADRFSLLGFRKDINELLACSDIFCFPSFREGLPVSLMEAMASGLPCVVSKIRGNVDLIEEGKGGFLCNPSNSDEFVQKIGILIKDKKLRERFSVYNMEKVKDFGIQKVNEVMRDIYKEKG